MSWRQKLGSGRVSVRPIEEDYRSASKKFWQTIRAPQKGEAVLNTVYTVGGELLTSTGHIVGRTVEGILRGSPQSPTDIRPEYLKSLDVVGLSWLTRLCSTAWRSGKVPLEWQTRVVVPLFKKGDRRCVFQLQGDHTSQPPQEGSTPGTSSIPSSRVLEGLWEFAQPVHMCFVDLEKVFDRVPRGILWGCSASMGIRGPLLRAVRSLYDRSRSLVCIASSKSDLFPLHVGLLAGLPFVTDDVVLLARTFSMYWGGLQLSVKQNQYLQIRGHGSRLPEKGGVPSPGGWRGPASSGGVQVSQGLVHE
ncbi:hypothetical protein L3Q82_021896 [Scortum barcoo]|uniref:Uncharacterized protein n=1 Tax=Scortum barcoo TaxID=214431 RepID=A0ACB8X509_9TELE|nr:hypothetical protein L3Q82_021896 [Scortum barcoo]